MNELAATGAAACRIGPGRLVLVVGPSGAGKDTLIDGARRQLAGRTDILFPARLITRAPHESEAFVSIDEAAFDAHLAAGRFALSWTAHGLRYAVPGLIDEALKRNMAVVVNVSRTVVEAARERYDNLCVVWVTAPPDERARRIAGRGREGEADRDRRLNDLQPGLSPGPVDIEIENVGPVDRGVRHLVAAITGSDVPETL
jgi:ribose 1,5-bisphosphokinase